MQVNVAGIRRNIKNLAHNYSDAQIKVREATSNDPWGPSATIMAEIADLTYNVVAFSEIMQMIWKRLNDHGKNWRHVYKSLILLEYLIKTGTEKVAQQCKENIFAIQTLREFQYLEEGKDQGLHVREKAKQLVQLLKDDERLKNERTKALKAKERFAQHASGFGSDGSIDGPTHRETPTWIDNEPRQAPEIEFVRPQTAGEEELQLQLAMAMSREEAEQEEAKRRSDDVRLQLALSQSEQDFKRHQDVKPSSSNSQQSHLLDLLDINLGAGATASPPGPEPWGMPQPDNRSNQMITDPWSRTSSPPVDPWQPPQQQQQQNRQQAQDIGWLSSVKSPPNHTASGTSVLGWLNNSTTPIPTSTGTTSPASAAAVASANGNITSSPAPIAKNSPWMGKPQQPIPADPWLGGKPQAADPWLPTTNSNTNSNMVPADPWAPNDILGLNSPPLAVTSPISDLDEFDVITNRSKSAQSTTSPINGANNNNFLASLLDDMDPLSTKKNNKTPQAFLGENSSLVNLDNLIKPTVPNNLGHPATYNPFSETTTAIPQRNNMFQQTQPVPSINQLKQQPFPVTLNQDPWAPVGNTNNPSQNNNNNNTPWMKPEAAASNPFLS